MESPSEDGMGFIYFPKAVQNSCRIAELSPREYILQNSERNQSVVSPFKQFRVMSDKTLFIYRDVGFEIVRHILKIVLR